MSILRDTRIVPDKPEKELSSKQRQAALLLANGSTIVHAAREVGVNEKTIDGWKKKPEFLAAIKQCEDDLYEEALSILKKAMKPALLCLVRNMDSKVSNYVQVQAASKLIEQSFELHKIHEIEQKYQELEELLKELGVLRSA